MERRTFIRNGFTLGLGAASFGTALAHNVLTDFSANSTPFFKLSLAQWSLHNAIWKRQLDPYDFTAKAKVLGFEGVEFVNQLYPDVMKAKDKTAALKQFISKINTAAKTEGIENVLIMIDGEGDLAVPSISERNQAIENHKAWIETAAAMGCHSIRINLFGERDEIALESPSSRKHAKTRGICSTL